MSRDPPSLVSRGSTESSTMRMTRIVRVVRLVRLMRILRASRMVNRWSDRLESTLSVAYSTRTLLQ
eukprot:660558-Prymnesium_polylepis.1